MQITKRILSYLQLPTATSVMILELAKTVPKAFNKIWHQGSSSRWTTAPHTKRERIKSSDLDLFGFVAFVGKMAALKLWVLSAVVLCVPAFPQASIRRNIKNTIFGDERLEGEAFEDLDAFSDIEMFTDWTTNPYRLPNTTVPIHYNVFWTVDLDPLRLFYEGKVEIQLRATQPNVNEIVLHSDHHELRSITLTQNNVSIPVTNVTEPQYHFLRIRPNTDLLYNANNPVVYVLTIEFGAPMRTDMYGIYQSWYRNNPNNQNETLWMASTQFQSTASRYAMPCYDEPKFKATFDITIRRQNNVKSWSNMQIRETVPAGIPNWSDDIYHRTPVMSTYLIAILVGDYQSIGNTNTFEVIARPGAINAGQGEYALDVGQKLLATMISHTGFDYYSVPNIKMTQAAIPDFGAGAMENWGLLTYREAYLMYDGNHTNSNYKQLIGYILSHEIAHMWFGNLVTNDWWDVLWLNEGFARYYQYFLTHWVETEMGFETRFIVEQVHTALLTDSANNPQPLTNPGVGSPAAVSNMFGTLSYNKGAAVIRMTEHMLGFEVQELGLQNYLRNNAFGVAVPMTLISELEAAGYSQNALQEYGPDFDFVAYYKSWTEQPGHPVLNVQVDHSTGRMTITQRRFNINTGYSNVNANWVIPITFATASNNNFNNTKATHILKDTVTVINRGSVGDEWVVLNKQQTGYYRVNYDDYTWDLIALALRQNVSVIHEYNRAQIVNDIFSYARAGLMTYTRAFSLLSFLENETQYAPWVAAITGFNWIRNRLQSNPVLLNQLQNIIVGWASNVMADIGYFEPANESFMRSYLRMQMAPFMCNMNVLACRQAAQTQFRALVDQNTPVPNDSRLWVYCNGLRQSTTTAVSDFNFMWNRFLTHNVYNEKYVLISALGCTQDVNSLAIYVNGIIQDNYEVRPQDYTNAWSSATSSNVESPLRVLQIINNTNTLQAMINAFGNARTPLNYIASRLRSEEEIQTYQNWVTQNANIFGNQANLISNDAESSRQSLLWVAEVAPDLNEFIAGGGVPPATTTTSTPAPSVPTTVTPPPLVEPTTPSLPDSATNVIISMTLIVFAVMANIML
ncbi:peptidase family m1 domain-containing protein [Phthorimaea operculella]|nr:peptidase family m1 domain-containing protein [Phthorimaea operculella]